MYNNIYITINATKAFMSNYPVPQIILGIPSTGQQGDSSVQAYNKFNIHTHPIGQSPNPLGLDIKVNFFVSAINALGVSLLPASTRILTLSKDRITLTSFPLLAFSNCTVYITDNTNSSNVTVIENITIDNTKDYITLPVSKSGILSASQSNYVPVENFSGTLSLSRPLTYTVFPIILKSLNKGYLTRLDVQLNTINNVAASCSLSVLINNVNVKSINILNIAMANIDLDLNTVLISSLLNKDDTVKIIINSLNSAATSVLLSYNLYLYRI